MGLTDALLLDPLFPFDYYIAARTDGVGGTGTLNDPFNGSTQARFDSMMRDKIPASSHVVLGPGVFSTNGYYEGASSTYGWQLKPGVKIVGSGIDVTTLKLVNATTSSKKFFAIGHALSTGSPAVANAPDFVEVSISRRSRCQAYTFYTFLCQAPLGSKKLGTAPANLDRSIDRSHLHEVPVLQGFSCANAISV
jgi:hypothetical protein